MRRRDFLLATAATSVASRELLADKSPIQAEVTLPRDRVPLSFIVDDSTCLVNMGHFCMPQFATAWPNRKEYDQPWQSWPREIPDAFVCEFGEWSAEHGVKGKYSIVPYPACVGWLDRELPGWSRRQLNDSLKLVRELMLPNWDVHPEMITHTRVVDLKTGRPCESTTPAMYENWFPEKLISVDHMAEYLAYALRILRNCDLPCEGITTPGGFGNCMRPQLGLAVFDAVRDVFGAELPHYFKYVVDGDQSTEPRLEHVRDVDTEAPRVVVNVPAGTGDWFGGWEGTKPSAGDRYANQDATAGRMVELIERRQPAVMLCHWPGMYCNGDLDGFRDFQRVVKSLDQRYGDTTIWMKISEIARYWAAKELTEISTTHDAIHFRAPFACPAFTIRARGPLAGKVQLTADGETNVCKQVSARKFLEPATWAADRESLWVCFDLPRGDSRLRLHFAES